MTTQTKKRKVQEETLHDLWIQKLQALYDIEHVLIKALPVMAKNSTNAELKKGFRDHLEETKEQAWRLEQIFGMFKLKPKKLACDGIRGIKDDAAWTIKHTKSKKARDAAIIAAASYTEHYEMAGYIAAIRWAEEMGHTKAVSLLQASLREEIAADQKLATLASRKIDLELPLMDDSE